MIQEVNLHVLRFLPMQGRLNVVETKTHNCHCVPWVWVWWTRSGEEELEGQENKSVDDVQHNYSVVSVLTCSFSPALVTFYLTWCPVHL